MSKITLFVDGELLLDDDGLVVNLLQHGLSMQLTMGTLVEKTIVTLKEMEKLMADINQVLMDAVGAVKASVDRYVADVTTELTKASPNIQGALDALNALRVEVDASDLAVKAALP